ncbi:unnamed protein product [Fraxinus pennsylvanica]|uniref:AB hydrolase-1 domain-containing protein n=1 Tax=Fraxinus pennsylvanica TaxID=56036 RepID=A0AAD1ZBW4_9LAMI|nr:unnamed protein product [Fraxinus pennsylvanica]
MISKPRKLCQYLLDIAWDDKGPRSYPNPSLRQGVRLQLLLEVEGHRVTVIDLGAFGINLRRLDELRTFSDYTMPMFEVMESIPPDENVVVVGYSLGGMNMAFAMEKYP